MQIKTTSVAVAAVFVSLQIAAIYRSNAQPAYVAGRWSDACPCDVPCPCWRTSRASARVCLNVHVFHIRTDESSASNIARLGFVLLMKPKAAYGAPSPSTLYIDSVVPMQQVVEVENLVRQTFGDLQTVRLPIRFSENHLIQSVEIPGVLDYKVRRGREAPTGDVANYLYSWLSKPVQGVALDVRYQEPGREAIHYSGTNSISAEFRLEKVPNADRNH